MINKVKIEVNIKDIYNGLTVREQREFLDDNIGDADTDTLINELEYRGYKVEKL